MAKAQGVDSGRRRGRMILWSLLVILAGSMIFPLSGYVYVAFAPEAQAQEGEAVTNAPGANERANYWRSVRRGSDGRVTASGPYVTDTLVQSRGEVWRQVRNGPIATIGPWVLGGVLLLILIYFLIFGSKRLSHPPTGRMVVRWTGFERIMHWSVATLFVLLAITGLSLLFGRAVLVPLFGLPGFSVYAQWSLYIHNFAGPLFLLLLLLMVIVWARYNVFRKHDAVWLKKAGGMFKKGEHPPAGRTNAGEKVWFWFIATFGLLGVGISGLVLDFPNFAQSRETMQTANVIHAVLAVIWVAIWFGHAYLGTIGLRGTLSGMTRGVVDEEWMREHHGVWYEEMQRGTAKMPGQREPAKVRPTTEPGAASPR